MKLWCKTQGSGQGLLLIHGNAASARWWDRVSAALPAGIQVVAPDLPGAGRTAEPAPETIGEAAAAVAAAAREAGLGRATVVGHSLGGSVALALALDHPDLVERLVMINSAPPSGLRTGPDWWTRVEGVAANPMVMRMALAAMAPTAPKDAYLHELIEAGVAESSRAMLPYTLALNRFDVGERARGLTIPTLVIHGKQDALVTTAMAEETAATIPGAVLEFWNDIGHSAPVEAPQRLAERLVAFMGAGS